ncbi:DUF6680 family protein [Hirschia baltica]|uniref:DUF6680 domain-containing protein n=1 Tax=Hirschia baltica (strain ATCC 49814 / DSM 5838 / IFAM 1418) TaxID=582402 RepID=C6XNL9_HIRBI|nr:DUF6680 family protein [Hirschia baltica]ACT58272.1 hypothetical protein Hbal_0570 [Hirschia baltica ATCC 49814]
MSQTIAIMIATIVGPVAAVGISLWHARSIKQRDQQLIVLRMLVGARYLAGDINHSTAINMVPIEFSKSPNVLKKHSAYVAEVNKKDADGQLENPDEAANCYTDLLQSIFTVLGYAYSHDEIRKNSILTTGFIERDNLYLSALGAIVKIEQHSKYATRATIQMADHVTSSDNKKDEV